MSEIRFNRWSHQSGTGGIYQDSSGNIGIGTSVPTSVLDIQGGSIKIGNDLLTSSGVSTFTSGLNVTGGSVGIGIDNPTKPLDIRTDSGVLIRGRTGSIDAYLTFQPTTGGRALTLRTVSSSFELYDTSAASSRMYWNYDGRTGINTNNPGTELHVQGTNGYAELRLSGNSGSGGSLEYFDSTTKLADIYADPSSNIVFRNTASNTERLRITSDGTLRHSGSNAALGQGDTVVKHTHYTIDGTTPGGVGDVTTFETISATSNGSDYKFRITKREGSGGGSCYLDLGGNSDGSISFGTNTSGNGTERLRITSGGNVQIANGNLVFSTSGTGIDFSATADGSGTTNSELFDDYEEGSFTPAWGDGSSAYSSPAPTYSTQRGDYTKVGNVVYYDIHLITTAWNSAGNSMWPHGLPFTTRSSGYQLGGGGIFCILGVDDAGAISNLTTQIAPSTTRVELYFQNASTGANYSGFGVNHVNENGTVSIRISGFYFTDS